MNATATVTLGNYSAPPGTSVASYLVKLFSMPSATLAQTQTVAAGGAGPLSVSFAGVLAGSYSATAQAVDASNAAIGPAASSNTITVSNPNVTVLIPTAVTLA